MEKYDYLKNIKNDIMECYDRNELKEENFERLYDEMFVSDSITGNASGSYYCNSWKAEESLTHNLDLLGEALAEFGSNYDIMESPEACDVTIRCYLLSQALQEVIDEISND